MRRAMLLAILLLPCASCGGTPAELDGPFQEPQEPPTSGMVTLDLSGEVTAPDGKPVAGWAVRYRYCYCLGGSFCLQICDYYNETVTGPDGRYAFMQPWNTCLFDERLDGSSLVVSGRTANGECWAGESTEPIICTSQTQTFSIRLQVFAPYTGGCPTE